MEKSRGEQRTFKKLKKEDGSQVEDIHSLLNTAKDFYAKLYSKKKVDSSFWPQFLNNTPKLNTSHMESCEGPITYEEAWAAIKDMKDDKSPGNDGLPAEFYKKYFYLIGTKFIEALNAPTTSLTKSQRTGLITLLCKNVEKSDDLNYWRPISLLNVDYKILSKSLCNRIKIIANEIIGSEQVCGIKGRTIFDNLHFLRNVYDYCKFRKIPCYVISFDQAKAFDRVDHEYLFATLDHMGFGPSFTRWVRLLYTNTESQVIINGFLTETFSLYCSVRQGCGLSPLLYARVRFQWELLGTAFPYFFLAVGTQFP
jgi:hypothetical protein